MKKVLAVLALLCGALSIASAVPAYPGKIRVTQPDGSVVTIQLHGDEWFHYVTDESGRVIARDESGFWQLSEMPSAEQWEQASRMRRSAGAQRAQAARKASALTRGTHRIPVILVAFEDTEFVIDDPRNAFSDLLNQDGYSANGGTGSVHDYYYENSHGLYDPVFDVYGPVTLPNPRDSYANNAGGALLEACRQLNSTVDFSSYDSDGDGYVDMTLMYYAGYNQAESADETTIWPHQSSVYSNTRFDGKYLGTYFCTSELRGSWGTQMCGIGTTTHEFAHSLGLPDFYDTDYYTNGKAGALYSYSLMCSGSYNNNGRTPPYLNAEELIMLGWMDGLTEITRKGTLTLGPVQDRMAYMTPTSTPDEYFLFECRNKTGWDRYLPAGGLLVYHVDKSSRKVTVIETDYTGKQYSLDYMASKLWSEWVYSNAVNENGSHPCFYLIPSSSQNSLNFSLSEDYIPFPGRKGITSYTPKDWEGVDSDYRFTDISYNNSQVTMQVGYTTAPGVSGTVMNTSIKPVRGARVTLRTAAGAELSAVTGVDGAFLFTGDDLSDATHTLTFSCDGYVSAESTVTVGRRTVVRDVYLRKVGEPEETTFRKYDPDGASAAPFTVSNMSDVAAAIHLTAAETAPYVGKQIKTISFQLAGDAESSVGSAYVFIDAGRTRRFTQPVESVQFGALNTVNIVAQAFEVPSGTDLYIGYGLTGCSDDGLVLAQECEAAEVGYYGKYNGNRVVTWSEMTRSGTYYTPVLSAAVGEWVEPELGFNYIANPKAGVYQAGERFDLTLVRYEDDAPSAVSWTFDGQAVSAASVTLTAGTHTVEALLAYPDGSNEVIRLIVTAE